MRKVVSILLLSAISLAAAVSAYWFARGESDLALPAAAYSASVPDQPLILFIGQPAEIEGFKQQELQSKALTKVPDWKAARQAARKTPIDGILFTPQGLTLMSPSDQKWLRKQLDVGITIVGIGIENMEFASVVGLSHVGSIGERVPIGKSGYRIIRAFAAGTPSDLDMLGNWIERRLNGDDRLPDGIKYPLITSFSQSRGTLDSKPDVSLFLTRLTGSINEAYQVRAEFQESMQKYKEN